MELEILRLDVTDRVSRDAVISDVLQKYGHIDVLINNAGVCSLGALEVLGESDLRAQFETNVFGPFSLMMAALPGMRVRRSGRIVNVSSVAAFFAPEFMAHYAATKYAMDALSVGLALELKGFNIQVTAVAPAAYGSALGTNANTPDAGTPYGHAPLSRYEAWITTLQDRTDISPVVEAIVVAATAPDPKLRYLVAPTTPPFANIFEEKQRFDEGRRATS